MRSALIKANILLEHVKKKVRIYYIIDNIPNVREGLLGVVFVVVDEIFLKYHMSSNDEFGATFLDNLSFLLIPNIKDKFNLVTCFNF